MVNVQRLCKLDWKIQLHTQIGTRKYHPFVVVIGVMQVQIVRNVYALKVMTRKQRVKIIAHTP